MPAPKKAKIRLTNLSIDEGSFVGAGDNPEAHITLFKNRGDDVPDNDDEPTGTAASLISKLKRILKWGTPKTTSQIVAERAFADEFYKLRSAFMESVWSILDLSDPDEMAGMMGKTVTEFASAAKRMIAAVGKVDTVKAADLQAIVDQMTAAVAVDAAKASTSSRSLDRDALVDVVGKLEAFEFPVDAVAPPPETTPEKEPPVKKTAAEILAALPADERAVVEADIAAKTKPAAATEPPAAPAAKAAPEVPEAVQKALDAMQKQVDDANKAAAAATAEAQKLRDEQEDAIYTQKARAFPGLDVTKTAKQLKAAYKRSPEEGAELESLLAASNAQAAKGRRAMTTTKGSSAPGDDDGDAVEKAEAAITKRVAELRKADPKLTEQQAYAKAYDEDPDAYDNNPANTPGAIIED